MDHRNTRQREASPDQAAASNQTCLGRLLYFLGALMLGAAVCLVYFRALAAPFVFDDSAAIVDNLSIRRLWPLVGEKTGPLNPPVGTPVSGRALVNLSLAINYHFHGLNPASYRAVNILLHILAALFLWAIVSRTLRLDYFQHRFDSIVEPLSFAVALIWALHPLVTECVVYVTQRTELMMGLLYLATIYCALRYWAATKPGARALWLVLSALACFSGMLCKEMMASAPVMVLLYERTFISKSFRSALSRSWPLYVGLALSWIPAIVLNYHGPRTPMAGFGLGVAAHHWWFTQAKVLLMYLKLAVWPWPLVIHYEIPYLTTFAEAWPWLLAAGLFAAAALVLMCRRSAVGFVAVWVFAILSPTLVIPLIAETAAERRMYLPLAALTALSVVGGYVLLCWAWQIITRHFSRSPSIARPVVVATFAILALAIVFGQLSARRVEVYRDELSLWQDAALHQPENSLVHVNLGIQLAETEKLSAAISHLQEAVRLQPDSSAAHFNLARAYEASQRFQDAINHYHTAVRLDPSHASSHYNLARLLDRSGAEQAALNHYRQALAAQPDFHLAHTELGILLLNSGNEEEAIKHFTAALRQQEDLTNYVNLIVALSQANQPAQAIPVIENALKLARSQGDLELVEHLEAELALLRDQINRAE